MAESDASIEAQLELKKRARRRLVGASALALLAAIVLPMVMDHEPRPSNQDIQVRIPSPEASGGFTSRILPTKPVATPLPPLPAADQAPAAEPRTELKSDTKPDTKPAARPEAAAPKAAPASSAAPAEKPDAHATAKAPEKAPPKAAEAKAETKAAEAEPKAAESKTAEHRNESAPAAAEQWVVQLGAYKEAGNVKLLMSKLKEMGVPAFTEKFDSPQGHRTRVRAGPFASREAAEKARAKAKIIGVDGPVAPK